MHTFLRILSFAQPLGMRVPQYLVSILLNTVFSVVNFVLMIPLLRVLFGLSDSSLVHQKPDFSLSLTYIENTFYYSLTNLMEDEGKLFALYFICGITVVSVFIANLFRYLSQLILASVQVRVIRNLRNSLFAKVLQLDLKYFTETRKGDILSRITSDVAEVEQSVISSLKAIIREPILIVGYFVALFSISAELTFYTLVLIPISGFLISFLTKRLKSAALRSQENMGEISSTLDESFSGIRVLKAFDASSYISGKFRKVIDSFAKQTFKIASRTNLASPTSEFLGVSVLSVILIIGGTRVLEGDTALDAAQFIGFLLIFAQVLNPAKAISAALSTIQRGISAGDRIFELMDQQSSQKNSQKLKPASFNDCIRFEEVSFAYEEKPVLNNVSLEVRKGESVALVGPSGGGKSTLSDLLLRFYTPSSGRITLDGRSLHQLDPASLRKLIGFVPQETILFNDTIAANIAFGYPEASQRAIEQAAVIAHADQFIRQLPQGYNTNIGERGTKLSGGQRQRISIARAVLRDPPVLILDEATSSLDPDSEKAVRSAIQTLMKDRTIIIIAHRLSTIQHADRIFVIDEGKIIEEGTHESLIRSRGLYKKFTELQRF